jgi:hypothetical protein
MRKILLLLVGTVVLWGPAGSVAGDSSPSLSKLAAKAETSDAKSDERPHASGAVSNPASTCKSQRSEPNFAASHSGQSFTQFYGTNSGTGRGAGANAFGKCVSTIAKHEAKSDAKSGVKSHVGVGAAPAMTCKAMRANDLAHFQSVYGTRPNAFGECVAEHANGKKG